MKKIKFKRLGPPCIVPVISQNLIETGDVVEVPELISSGLWSDKKGWAPVVEETKSAKPKKEAVSNG